MAARFVYIVLLALQVALRAAEPEMEGACLADSGHERCDKRGEKELLEGANVKDHLLLQVMPHKAALLKKSEHAADPTANEGKAQQADHLAPGEHKVLVPGQAAQLGIPNGQDQHPVTMDVEVAPHKNAEEEEAQYAVDPTAIEGKVLVPGQAAQLGIPNGQDAAGPKAIEGKVLVPGQAAQLGIPSGQDQHRLATDVEAADEEVASEAETKGEGVDTEVDEKGVALVEEGGGPNSFSWRSTGEVVARGKWCQVSVPSWDWTLKRCSADSGPLVQVKVMTYNVFWWNLFGEKFRNGNGGSAGRLIREKERGRPYDFMGFQECDDVDRVLNDAGLAWRYATVWGSHSIAMAYRKEAWTLLEHGVKDVAEDKPEQWYGSRAAQWARFRHIRTGKIVLFVNHHGPLPVGSGGICGTRGTAYNLLYTLSQHARTGDGIIMVGDFNSDAGTEEVREIEHRLHRVFTGPSFGGVDHIFSNCGGGRIKERRDLGNGGSDHHALDAIVEL